MIARVLRAIVCAGALATSLASAPAVAYDFNERVSVYGYAQVWAIAWEQMKDQKGLFQHPSGDEAADGLSGFSIAKARVGIRLAYPDWHLTFHGQVKLDHEVGLLDADAAWTPARWLSLHLGQFKIPGTYEALEDDRRLDFILRTDITTALADYALAKAQNPTSLLVANASNLRDLGIALKGEIGNDLLVGRYFLMVGNGLGANMFFGGLTRKEYFITNRGQFFYGARFELSSPKLATLGVFGSYNRHDNIVFNSGKDLCDINRRMLGGDLRVVVPGTGLRLGALGGGGQIRDDFAGDGRIDLKYSGWAVSAAWDIFSVLRRIGWSLPERHAVELAGRFERMDEEVDESGYKVRRERKTVGLNYVASDLVKVQLEYVWRRTDDPAAVAPDLANNVLFANFQVSF